MAFLHDDGEVGFEEGKLLLPSNVLDEACDSNNKVSTNIVLVSLLYSVSFNATFSICSNSKQETGVMYSVSLILTWYKNEKFD